MLEFLGSVLLGLALFVGGTVPLASCSLPSAFLYHSHVYPFLSLSARLCAAPGAGKGHADQL